MKIRQQYNNNLLSCICPLFCRT